LLVTFGWTALRSLFPDNAAAKQISAIRKHPGPATREVLRVVDACDWHFDYLVDARDKLSEGRIPKGAFDHVGLNPLHLRRLLNNELRVRQVFNDVKTRLSSLRLQNVRIGVFCDQGRHRSVCIQWALEQALRTDPNYVVLEPVHACRALWRGVRCQRGPGGIGACNECCSYADFPGRDAILSMVRRCWENV
jgi:hypothetical protein